MERLTHKRANGIKPGYWSPAKKQELVDRLAIYEEREDAKDTNVPGKWIPCSERLPEVDGMYTTTLSGELVGTDKPFVGQSYFEDGYWEEDGDCVIAWMPLPEPYREVTDEENLESRR